MPRRQEGRGLLHARAAEAARDEHGTVRQISGTERTLDADVVLLAIGFDGPVRDRLLEDLAVQFEEAGAIRADSRYNAGNADLFVAGDARRGASLIVWAIAEGRAAAEQIDRSIRTAALRAG